MKNILTGIIICILSLIITFITFENLSWYHFGDIPTRVVLFRLIIFFIIVVAIITGIILVINKLRKK